LFTNSVKWIENPRLFYHKYKTNNIFVTLIEKTRWSKEQIS